MHIFRISFMEIGKVLLILAGMVLAVEIAYLYFHSASRELRIRQIPQLPNSAEILGKDSGGFFASWLLIASKLDRKSYDGYKKIIRDESSEKRNIPRDAVILKAEDYKDGTTDGGKPIFKQQVNGAYFTWWTTDSIAHGEVDEKRLGPDSGYSIYFDDDRSMVFIYWSDG